MKASKTIDEILLEQIRLSVDDMSREQKDRVASRKPVSRATQTTGKSTWSTGFKKGSQRLIVNSNSLFQC